MKQVGTYQSTWKPLWLELTETGTNTRFLFSTSRLPTHDWIYPLTCLPHSKSHHGQPKNRDKKGRIKAR